MKHIKSTNLAGRILVGRLGGRPQRPSEAFEKDVYIYIYIYMSPDCHITTAVTTTATATSAGITTMITMCYVLRCSTMLHHIIV